MDNQIMIAVDSTMFKLRSDYLDDIGGNIDRAYSLLQILNGEYLLTAPDKLDDGNFTGFWVSNSYSSIQTLAETILDYVVLAQKKISMMSAAMAKVSGVEVRA
jgi:hypothetical protein